MELPLISCVCVSKNRPEFLKKAISYFSQQTYANKELIIVHENDNTINEDVGLQGESITVIQIPSGSEASLGERRNISIQHCKGEYFCQWDDDDWFHHQRLEIQMKNLLDSAKPALVLNRLLLYDQLRHRGYLSSGRFWEGTLLCKTELFDDYIQYPKINRGEDNELLVKLVKRDLVHSIHAPYLYAYLFHGANTWNSNHFQQLFQAGYALTPDLNLHLKKTITGEYDYIESSLKLKSFTLPEPPKN